MQREQGREQGREQIRVTTLEKPRKYFIYRPIIVGNTTFMFLIFVGFILHLITGLTSMALISDNAFNT